MLSSFKTIKHDGYDNHCPYCGDRLQLQKYREHLKMKCPDCDHTTQKQISYPAVEHKVRLILQVHR